MLISQTLLHGPRVLSHRKAEMAKQEPRSLPDPCRPAPAVRPPAAQQPHGAKAATFATVAVDQSLGLFSGPAGATPQNRPWKGPLDFDANSRSLQRPHCGAFFKEGVPPPPPRVLLPLTSGGPVGKQLLFLPGIWGAWLSPLPPGPGPQPPPLPWPSS